jgi:hypothetical protein
MYIIVDTMSSVIWLTKKYTEHPLAGEIDIPEEPDETGEQEDAA